MQNELMIVLSNISKAANCNLLGDCSGDSISKRTARGLGRQINRSTDFEVAPSDVSLAHALMISTYLLIRSGNILGGVVLAGLISFYQSGKKTF